MILENKNEFIFLSLGLILNKPKEDIYLINKLAKINDKQLFLII